ncbi:major facilitator superfamily domain-containing protein [Radiomyces spectabilis]|uniref:major facilitator superfamily domain-containing protein n=1 Tax=Radiomyces spectabilis TaxID=64574 RepID=UPI00221E4408|nr:major facilitator superfamily domain-containing protein [Radiomyces spectabilis]KAI8388256.1 major facilitator superfamily domain-containing protein [Radiomyces spectabilis]
MQELEELVSRIQDRDIKEKQLVKSLDNHLLPLFCIFYFADYLDRANIGNAALMGIQDDLKMTDGQLSFAISAFYITYIIFHVPSNVIMKRTNASIWLSSIMFAWGTITIVTAFVRNFAGLLSCRLILGVAESGYIPGILYQLSSVYKPRELGIRIAVMLCMSQLSGIVSGPIAYGTSFLEGRMHMHGWQYLFILEGVPTVVLSIASYCLLFDDVNTVSWLTDEQKALQQYRMTENRPLRSKHTHVTLSTFKEALVDWKLWLFAITYLCNATNMTSASIFAPRIIDGFGFTVLQSQLLTAPPSLVSSALVILSGYFVDKYYRFPFMLVGFALLAIGYGLLLVLDTPWCK